MQATSAIEFTWRSAGFILGTEWIGAGGIITSASERKVLTLLITMPCVADAVHRKGLSLAGSSAEAGQQSSKGHIKTGTNKTS